MSSSVAVPVVMMCLVPVLGTIGVIDILLVVEVLVDAMVERSNLFNNKSHPCLLVVLWWQGEMALLCNSNATVARIGAIWPTIVQLLAVALVVVLPLDALALI